MGLDAYDVNVLPNLSEVMRKRAFYDADQAAGMNIILDKTQGFVGEMPMWATPIMQLLQEKPKWVFGKLTPKLPQIYIIFTGLFKTRYCYPNIDDSSR